MQEYKLTEDNIKCYIQEYKIPENDAPIVYNRLSSLTVDLNYVGEFMNAQDGLNEIVRDITNQKKVRNLPIKAEEIYTEAIESLLYRIAEDRLAQYNKKYISAEEI